MKRYCLACDLKDDPELIEEYKSYHAAGKAWPEITQSILAAGITHMDIYLIGNRLCMIMEVDDSFDFNKKAALDKNNPKVQDWEKLMWKFQQELPWAENGEKWMVMENIFQLGA